jgi:NAD(P)-dependent dehydrogenase (short-subunit alcohol dehydrogenase family)
MTSPVALVTGGASGICASSARALVPDRVLFEVVGRNLGTL